MNITGALELYDFSLGLDLISNPTMLDIRSLADCENVYLTPRRGLQKRGGLKKFIEDPVSEIGGYIKQIYNYKTNTNNILLVHYDNNLVYYDTKWNILKDNINQFAKYSFVTFNNICYAVNGYENIKIVNNLVYNIGITPPANQPTLQASTGNLTGTYAYVYCYYNSNLNIYSNPSPISDIIEVSNQGIQVSYQASSDEQADKIAIFRTFELGVNPPAQFYLVAVVDNEDGSFVDDTPDSELGMEVSYDNGKPPVAKYVTVYQNRIFYANCPDEPNGESVVYYSNIGNGDTIGIFNYEYFGLGDGDEITGIASLPNYLVIFKRNKLFTIAGDFQLKRLEVSDYKIGCIDANSIVKVENVLYFLSDSGWYCFDGEKIYPVSKSIAEKLKKTDYFNNTKIFGVFYPRYSQLRYLITGSSIDTVEFVGTCLFPTINFAQPMELTLPENATFISWTKNTYPNHNLTCLCLYEDNSENVRILAGSEDGYVYELEFGTTDEDEAIPILIQTGWLSFGKPKGITYLLRHFKANFYTGGDDLIQITFEVDFLDKYFVYSFTSVSSIYCGESTYCGETYCGGATTIIEHHNTSAGLTGKFFRFKIYGTLFNEFSFNGITLFYRVKRVREY